MTDRALSRATEVANWLQERYRTDRLRGCLKGLIDRVSEARRALESARAGFREVEMILAGIDAELLVSVNTDPDLKNAESRKAAFERLKATDPERLAALDDLEKATRQRDQAAGQLDEGESTLKGAFHVLNMTTAELEALASIIKMKSEA